MANPSVFEDYFRRADSDKDGRISGVEAVSFFQGANLPQVTLAKIWQFADQGQTGFLSKLEFYNALKLVTVAQSGRELTPEIVRAALAGPAAAQIPAPRISTPSSQPSSYGASSVPSQVGSGNLPDQFSSGSGVPPRSWSSQPTPVSASNSGQAGARPGSASGQRAPGGFTSDTWPSIRSSSGAAAPPQTPGSVTPAGPTYPAAPGPAASLQGKKDTSGQGFQSSDGFFNGAAASKPTTTFTSSSLVDAFGGDPFAATPKALVPVSKTASSSALSQGFSDFGDGGFHAGPATMALVPTTVPSRHASKELQVPGPLTRSSGTVPITGSGQGFGGPPPAGAGLGAPWPRITPSDTQRYNRVFAEVDTDRDGKISGEQARDLFLSWCLPREVLKQVWDLSDQDGDSMLSMREFCIALYLMERFQEGRPLPPVLPSGLFSEDQHPETYPSGGTVRIDPGRPPVLQNSTVGYNVPSWQQNSGVVQPTGTGYATAPRPFQPAAADYPTSSQTPAPGVIGDTVPASQYKSKAPVLEKHLVNQLSRDEQETLKSRHKDAEEADKKAHDLDKQIMDYREKAEFYRSKLQEIILFKSRCENRLGEITERAAADKREMESLAKKYDERFKAAGEVNSRLLAEEAAFRDIQEKKIELYNAIAKMEQGGDVNGLLQSKADRISSELDELKKALNERAKRLGLHVKQTAPTEQQFGWQTGLQEKAAEWDEDWDKFDDEGFVSVQDIMDDGLRGNFTDPAPKPSGNWDDSSPLDGGFDFTSSPKSGRNIEVLKEHHLVHETTASGQASPRAESEVSGRSGPESPTVDLSTSSSQAVDKSSLDRPANASKANQRYANLTESQEDLFNGPTSYSSTTNSFDQGPQSYNSDTFGDGGVSWAAAFDHDEEVDSGIRASWGLQSNPPSTQASLDVTGSRTSRFGKRGLAASHGLGGSLDIGSMHVSSPGRIPDISSPTLSHRGNGTSRDSEEYDGFGPLGASKDFDRSPSFFGTNHNMHSGNALFDSPRKSGAGSDRNFARFDSFTSPQHNPSFPVVGEEHRDNSYIGGGKDQNDHTFARFDSFSSVKTDGGRGRAGMFGSFDDGDDLFAGMGPFGAQDKKASENGWSSQEKKTSDHGWSAF